MGQIKTKCSSSATGLFFLLLMIVSFSSCTRTQKDIIPSAEYAPYINAYTGGVISQNSTIRIELTHEQPMVDLNNELIKRAFTHSSYVNETKKGEDYERLEFLGDKVLDFLVSEYLYVNEHLHEGEMTKLRANYVCENALYEYSKELGLNNYLRLGKGEEASGGRDRKAVVADIFEAFLAATYLTYGLEKAKEIVYDVVIKAIENNENYFLHDYKSVLQEMLQADKQGAEYVVVNEEGPSHNKTFTTVVKIDGVILGEGTAGSKKESEQEAAKDALSKMAKVDKKEE